MRFAPFVGKIISITLEQIMIFVYDHQKPYRHLYRPDFQIWMKRRNITHSWQRLEVKL